MILNNGHISLQICMCQSAFFDCFVAKFFYFIFWFHLVPVWEGSLKPYLFIILLFINMLFLGTAF